MDEYTISKPNRRGMQDRRDRAHAHVMHSPLGLPEWEREKPRKRRNLETALTTKQARDKGLPKRKR